MRQPPCCSDRLPPCCSPWTRAGARPKRPRPLQSRSPAPCARLRPTAPSGATTTPAAAITMSAPRRRTTRRCAAAGAATWCVAGTGCPFVATATCACLAGADGRRSLACFARLQVVYNSQYENWMVESTIRALGNALAADYWCVQPCIQRRLTALPRRSSQVLIACALLLPTSLVTRLHRRRCYPPPSGSATTLQTTSGMQWTARATSALAPPAPTPAATGTIGATATRT